VPVRLEHPGKHPKEEIMRNLNRFVLALALGAVLVLVCQWSRDLIEQHRLQSVTTTACDQAERNQP
jgi:hypothetical protein